MTGSETFLDKDPTELRDYLLEQARGDRAPGAAQQRALLRVASLSLGAGVALNATSALGANVAPSTPWLVGKWILVGMSATVLTFSAAEQAQRALGAGEVVASARPPMRAVASVSAARLEMRPNPPIIPESVVNEPAGVRAPAPSSTALGATRAVEGAATPLAATPSPSETSAVSFGSASNEATARLVREVGKLKATRAALAAGEPASALRALDEYEHEFPDGALSIEAAALRVEALAKLGDRGLASRLATQFLQQHASSPLAERVRTFVGAVP